MEPLAPPALPPPTVLASYRYAWDVLQRRWPRLLAIVLLWVMVVLAGTVAQLAWERGEDSSRVGSVVGTLYGLLVVGPIEIGALWALLKAVRGRPPEVDDLFFAFRHNYLAAVLTPLLAALIVFFGLLLFVLPGLYLALRLSFVGFLVVDEGMGPLDALAESWRRTDGRVWALLGITLLGLFAVWVGFVLLIVGAFVGMMWAGLAFATLYAVASRERHQTPRRSG